MKKTCIALSIALVAVVITSVSIVYSFERNTSVSTDISELGIGTTVYDPPETYTMYMDGVQDNMAWTYQYTASVPVDHIRINIGGANLSRNTYYYTDQSGNTIIVDTQGRLVGYETDSLNGEQSYWKADDTTEEELLETLKMAAGELGIDAEDYTDIHYSAGRASCTLYMYKDEDSPYSDYVFAQFNLEGDLIGIVVYYTDIQTLLSTDINYFDSIIEQYLADNGKTFSHTIDTTYRVLDNVLLASYDVAFSDSEQGTWVESYIAGKPLA